MDCNRHVAKVAGCLVRYPRTVLAFALLASLISGWAVARLPVLTSREALLPRNTGVVQRLDAFLSKFGVASDLIVVLEGAPREDLEAFAAKLASELPREPEIARVDAHLDTKFLLEHAYLLMPVEWLARITSLADGSAPRRPASLERWLALARDGIRKPPALADVSLQTASEGLTAVGFVLEEWKRWLSTEQAPRELDPYPLLSHYGAGELARGDFASRDGRMLFVFVHPRASSEDAEARRPFIEKVRAVVAQTSASMHAAGRTPPQVGLAGLPAIEYEEYVAIQQDIVLVIATAAALIAVLILLVVRSLRWAAAIFVPMGFGALWSQALVYFTVGHLTIITSGFIAILFGLGADYGIFTSSRIAEERRAGRPLGEAIPAGIAASFPAVLTAGGASVAIFAALATVEFPGFAELGAVAAAGVLLILLSTWLVQPALYMLLPPRVELPAEPAPAPEKGGAAKRSGSLPLPLASAVVVAAAGLAGLGAVRGLAIPFDYDALSLLPATSEAVRYQRRMAAESDYQGEVVVFTASHLDEARRIAEEAGRLDSVAKVQSLTNLFPADAEERSRKARALGQLLTQAGYDRDLEAMAAEGVPKKAFESLRALLDQSLELIDGYQEQAFSAGHSGLVADLEQVRGIAQAVRSEIERDPQRSRERSEALFKALLQVAGQGLEVAGGWRGAGALSLQQIPTSLRNRFVADDGTFAVYAFPAKSVYDPVNLQHLMEQVYGVSPDVTGFPATSQAFSESAVRSFYQGTLLAVVVCLVWLLLVLRSIRGFMLASLPLLIGGGWMLGLMSMAEIRYNYANIIALPLVIALAVDYGVWFSHRWRELDRHSPFEITLIAGKVIALAAGTELAGLGAITLASYRGISSMGVNITVGLLCCLAATLVVAPLIGQLIYPGRNNRCIDARQA